MSHKICNDKTGADKKLHALVCFAIGAVLAFFLSFIKLPTPFIAAVIAFVGAMAVGIYKEIRDSKQPGNHFCVWDILSDAVGAILAAALAYLANYYTWHDAVGNLIN